MWLGSPNPYPVEDLLLGGFHENGRWPLESIPILKLLDQSS